MGAFHFIIKTIYPFLSLDLPTIFWGCQGEVALSFALLDTLVRRQPVRPDKCTKPKSRKWNQRIGIGRTINRQFGCTNNTD